MRILHVTETYASGVARALRAIVQAAPQHEHHLLYAGWERPPDDAGIATLRPLPTQPLSRVRAVRAAVRDTEADVVHLHSSWAGVYGRVLPLPARVVYQPHCFAFEDRDRSAAQRAIFRAAERLLGRRTDTLVAVSERERRLGGEVASGARIVLVPNRSDLERLDVRADAGPRRAVVMSGEVRAQKDPALFAELARACGAGTEAVWVGAGDAALTGALRAAGVRVTGWLGADGVRDELDRAAVYLHTAKYEGFPLSVLDAVARQIPVLVRDAPAFEGLGLTTFVDVGEACRLIDEHCRGTSDALVRNTDLLRRQFDPAALPDAVAELYGPTDG